VRIVTFRPEKILQTVAGFAETEFPAAVTVGDLPQPVEDMGLGDPRGEKSLRLDPGFDFADQFGC